ncbi:hypothetical protein CYLTODRAFT_67 [Cylindrobasidium torrendii FP15055 ss-10]|uniref:Uncharacterized protein n=1 Tax=Cylindrobasidium torrendii FP15055 ss-10 TaxID=1314674 RepID=A0A0D7BVH7_9AGAR|nr:hypothetical protein CYLTODRAFT_67 [Cylindrobasidium torrendii FP15055 ss-10]
MSIESKLKALKVPELKAIITASEVSVTSKANKGDLIAAIIASQKAVSTYYALHDPEGQPESHAAEPEEAQTQEEPVVSAPPKEDVPAQATPAEAKKPASSNANKADASAEASKTDVVVDVELEKRKARAARFQIPLVEKVPASTTGGKGRQRKAPEVRVRTCHCLQTFKPMSRTLKSLLRVRHDLTSPNPLRQLRGRRLSLGKSKMHVQHGPRLCQRNVNSQ